jgi:hypothetical protein
MTRQTPKSLVMSVASLGMLLVLSLMSIADADEVTVYLKSGRRFTANISDRTNDDVLWLRFGTSSTVLLRPVNWSQVDRATYQNEAISVSDLRTLADEIKSASDIVVSEDNRGSFVFAHGQTDADRAREIFGFTEPMATVSFHPQIANWDKDVEPDGLVIDIQPLDLNGNIVPVGGTLAVDLVASRRRLFNEVPHGRGGKFEQLGRWVRQITPQDITAGGARLRLPFQANDPAFDTDWAAHALVHVRFAVPGHGVFEDSVDPVRVRRWSPIRDELERKEDRRFFPIERTGRGTR